MKILGITAEYNPFHNGHKYHIEQSRKETDADICAVVMSGNFVQRGAPAICDKWTRASWAIENGADIVFELPVVYSLATAETFAYGAIYLLDAINCNYVSFGAENSLCEIKSAYSIYKNSEHNFNFAPETPFHISRTNMDNSFEILKHPNNILAFEYLKAIDKTLSAMTPIVIKRTDKGYNSLNIEKLSSATAIRSAIMNGNDFHGSLPSKTENFLKEFQPVHEDLFINLIKYAVLTNKNYLKDIHEIREGLENKIYKIVCENNFSDFESMVKSVKSKRYTYTAISRMLFQALLQITKEDLQLPPQYLRVLSFNSNGQKLLKKLKDASNLPIITKPADYISMNENRINMIKKDFLATDIYNLILNKKGKADLTTSPVIIF